MNRQLPKSASSWSVTAWNNAGISSTAYSLSSPPCMAEIFSSLNRSRAFPLATLTQWFRICASTGLLTLLSACPEMRARLRMVDRAQLRTG